MTAIATRYTMPEGEITSWDVVQECAGHKLAKEFAREWTVDHDCATAVLRLGFTGGIREAGRLGKVIYAHSLTQAYICEFTKDIATRSEITEETVLELLMAEATDKGFGSSAPARVAALKTLKKHFDDLKKLNGFDDDEEGEPVVNIFLTTEQPTPA